MTKFKAKVCRDCGNDFRPEVRGQAYCINCRNVRANEKAAELAARPFVTCRKCGEQKQDCSKLGDCAECRAKRREECRLERRRLYEEFQRERERREGQCARSQLRKSFKSVMSKLSPDEQALMLKGLLQWVVDNLEEAQEVDPEQVDAANQDAIDAAFRSLMDGVV